MRWRRVFVFIVFTSVIIMTKYPELASWLPDVNKYLANVMWPNQSWQAMIIDKVFNAAEKMAAVDIQVDARHLFQLTQLALSR